MQVAHPLQRPELNSFAQQLSELLSCQKLRTLASPAPEHHHSPISRWKLKSQVVPSLLTYSLDIGGGPPLLSTFLLLLSFRQSPTQEDLDPCLSAILHPESPKALLSPGALVWGTGTAQGDAGGTAFYREVILLAS